MATANMLYVTIATCVIRSVTIATVTMVKLMVVITITVVAMVPQGGNKIFILSNPRLV